jgi:hypothetical protein
VNPNLRATTYSFQYGTTTAYGSETGARDAGAGNAPADASAGLAGLAPGTTYHYRVVATNCTGQIALRFKRVGLGAARFAVPGGRTAAVTVRLTHAATRLLARKPKLAAVATLTASANGATRDTSAHVALRTARKSGRR